MRHSKPYGTHLTPVQLNRPSGKLGSRIDPQQTLPVTQEDIDLLGLKQALTSLQAETVVNGIAPITALPVTEHFQGPVGAALKHWPLLRTDTECHRVVTEDRVFAEACSDTEQWQEAKVAELRCEWLDAVMPQVLGITDHAIGLVNTAYHSQQEDFFGFVDPITTSQYATPTPLFAQGPQHVLAAAGSSYRRLDLIRAGDVILLRKGIGVIADIRRVAAKDDERSITKMRVVQFSASHRPAFGRWQLRKNRDEFFLVSNIGNVFLPEVPLPSRRTDAVSLSNLEWRVGCPETGDLLTPPWMAL